MLAEITGVQAVRIEHSAQCLVRVAKEIDSACEEASEAAEARMQVMLSQEAFEPSDKSICVALF